MAAADTKLARNDGDAVEAADDPAPRSRLADELRESSTPPTLAAAIIAWALTLAPSGFGRGASLLAGFLSVTALAAGIVGPIVGRAKPRLGRHIGISLFLALATATW